MEEKNYSVYLHKTPDGRVYVGATKHISSRFGKNGSGYKTQYFYSAIEKFGWDRIKHTVIKNGLSKDEAEELEADLIAKYNATDPDFGYNIRPRGIYVNDKPLIGKAYDRIVRLNRSMEHIKASNEAAKNRRGRKMPKEAWQKMYLSKVANGTFGKPCVCIETGKVYETYAEAARDYGVSDSCIRDACLGITATSALKHWCHLGEEDSFAPQKGVRPVKRRVTCVETGEIFSSLKDAAKAVNRTESSISFAARHEGARCAGFHWIYTDGEWKMKGDGF